MSRAPRFLLITSLAVVFFGGRVALAHEAHRVATACYLAASNNFGGLPLRLPAAGMDIEELTGKARACLSMINTMVRRYKKIPIKSAAASSGIPNSANVRPLNDDDEEIVVDSASNFPA
jgi:hypothetical protein